MKRRQFIKTGSVVAVAGTGMVAAGCDSSSNALLGETQIQHGVIFSLKHEPGSELAKKFLTDGKEILSAIPVVQHFQAFKQVSLKNDYQYGFTMVFDSMEDYKVYNEHPDHVSFVEKRWMKEVDQFLEIDFEVY